MLGSLVSIKNGKVKSSLPEANRHDASDAQRYDYNLRDSPEKRSGQAIPTFGAGQVMTFEKL
jgi:hypothetical protein